MNVILILTIVGLMTLLITTLYNQQRRHKKALKAVAEMMLGLISVRGGDVNTSFAHTKLVGHNTAMIKQLIKIVEGKLSPDKLDYNPEKTDFKVVGEKLSEKSYDIRKLTAHYEQLIKNI